MTFAYQRVPEEAVSRMSTAASGECGGIEGFTSKVIGTVDKTV